MSAPPRPLAPPAAAQPAQHARPALPGGFDETIDLAPPHAPPHAPLPTDDITLDPSGTPLPLLVAASPALTAAPTPTPRAPAALLSLTPGQRLDRFEVLSVLGRGGMGAVYEAFNHTLKRRVALKVLYASGPEVLESIEREAQNIARLEHPNIVQVYHLGALPSASGGLPTFYIEMQRVEGAPLSSLAAEGPLPLARLVALLTQVAEALAHAHERGVVHRDVKPENALVTAEGGVKLIDFGIAGERGAPREGDHGRAGTPLYMAPEVWRDGAWGVPSDIYAWGVMAYRLAAGAAPFSAAPEEGWRGLMAAHVLGERAPLSAAAPGLPGDFCALVDSCLALDPAARPSSARALVDALEELADELRAQGAAGGGRVGLEGDGRLRRAWRALWARRADLARLAGVLALSGLAVWGRLLEGPNHVALDLVQSLQPPPAATPVGLVALDEAAYLDREAYLEREALSALVSDLLARGARAVGVELIHHRPSKPPAEGRDEAWAALARDPRVLHVVAPLAVSAEALSGCALHGESLTARAPKRKTLAGEGALELVRPWQAASLRSDERSPSLDRLGLRAGETREVPAEDEQEDEQEEERSTTAGAPLEWATRERHTRLIAEPRLLFPFARLLEQAIGLAHIGLYPDSDGVVRHAPLLLRSGDRVFPSLGLLIAARALGAGLEHISYARGHVTISPPGGAPVAIPVDECAQLTLRVRGEPSQRPQAPLLALIGQGAEPGAEPGAVPGAVLGARAPLPAEVLLLSPTALASGDWGALSHWRHTPLSLAHLVTAENILNADFVRVAPLRWALALALLLCGGAFWHAQRARAGWALPLLLAHGGGAVGVGLSLLVGWGLQTPLVLLTALTALASLYGASVQSARERARRHALAQRVGEALPPRLLERLLDGEGAQVEVPTRRAPLGVVAVCLEGLDALGDAAPPPALAAALAALSDALHALALRRGGLVVSAGRGLAMVTFKRDTPEERAREAAAFARELRASWEGELWRWRALGAPPRLGVAVEEGAVALGPLSVSRDSFYGLHGALAERVERLARGAHGQTLVSARVAALIGAREEEEARAEGAPRVTQGPAVVLGGVETRSFYLEG